MARSLGLSDNVELRVDDILALPCSSFVAWAASAPTAMTAFVLGAELGDSGGRTVLNFSMGGGS